MSVIIYRLAGDVEEARRVAQVINDHGKVISMMYEPRSSVPIIVWGKVEDYVATSKIDDIIALQKLADKKPTEWER